MAKTEVYSWRVSTRLKRALEDAAQRQKQSISSLLDHIVTQFFRHGPQDSDPEETAQQERLRAAGLAALGRIKSGRTNRAAQARDGVRAKLRQFRHERARAH